MLEAVPYIAVAAGFFWLVLRGAEMLFRLGLHDEPDLRAQEKLAKADLYPRGRITGASRSVVAEPHLKYKRRPR